MPRKIVKPRSQQAGRKGELALWGVILGALLVVIGYGAVLAIRGMGSTSPVSPTAAVGGDIRRIPVAEARAMVDAGTAVLVDTRTTEYYARQHAQGALSLPVGQEAALVNTLPRDKLVIFYCTWPDEATSVSVAQLVVQNGFPAEQVAALLGGYEAWVNGGHPVTLAE